MKKLKNYFVLTAISFAIIFSACDNQDEKIDETDEVSQVTNNKKSVEQVNIYYSLEEALKNPEMVYELNLSNQNLTELPPEIGKLTNIMLLEIIDSKLTNLPPEIGKLSNLTYLNLYGNQLTELPQDISKLTNLIFLSLVGNQLTKKEQKKIKKLLPNCEIYF